MRMLSGNQTGQTVDMPRHEAENNVQCGLAEWVDGEPGSPPPDVAQFHTGGGMYTLPSGKRVRGRAAAMNALSAEG